MFLVKRRNVKKENEEFFEALELLTSAKGASKPYLIEKIRAGIAVAVRREYGCEDSGVVVTVCPENRELSAGLFKTVVESVTDPVGQIALKEAKKIDKGTAVGRELVVPVDMTDLGYRATHIAKSLILQGVSEAVDEALYERLADKRLCTVPAKVLFVHPTTRGAVVLIDRFKADLPRTAQLPDDHFEPGDDINVFVADVRRNGNRPSIVLSRRHPMEVKRALEEEVPEIQSGVVKIAGIARDAGSRSKVAVLSADKRVDPIGVSIGHKASRIHAATKRLHGEKVDLVRWSKDPLKYVAFALSPAMVLNVFPEPMKEKTCRAVVPHDQVSLAIGPKAQNVRLASELTGWDIHICGEYVPA